MRLKISINFDFGKLNNQLNSVMGEYLTDYSVDSVKLSKKNIDSGVSPKTLKKSTLDWRKRKGYPSSPPLKASGKLYNSINALPAKKTSKKVLSQLEVVQYGWWHNIGDLPPQVPQREFIQLDPKTKLQLDNQLMSDMNTALHLNSPIVLKF